MPLQQILPTWLAINNANFTSPTGLTDLRTGQTFEAGGLGLGDYFDLTEKEANGVSFAGNGLLHSGRYRLVQVDSGATAANVRTGTAGFAAQGKSLQSVGVGNPGTGGTPGTYSIPASLGSGGGSGAVIQVVVGASGAITSASVVQGGFNYVSPPTFPLTVTAVTGGVLFPALNTTPNVVTSADVAFNPPGLPILSFAARPVVFLNSITPGNYGFVQELGVAAVLISAPGGNFPPGSAVVPLPTGMMNLAAQILQPGAIGQLVDNVPTLSQPTLAKCYMLYVPVVQD
jgi:hypothetical protein